jgi:hypothetical protein
MSESTGSKRRAPEIERVQHNVEGAEWVVPVTGVDTEHAENFDHFGPSARGVLANGNWIEYHRLDADTMVECAFVLSEVPDDEPEALLENRLKIRSEDVTDTAAFLETVATSVEVYRRDIDTVEDAKELWQNVVPAVEP